MKSEQAYLDALAAALHTPDKLAALKQQWTAQDAAGSTAVDSLGLHFYVRSARHRRLTFARNVYGELWSKLNREARQLLEQRYLSQPSGEDLDWSHNTAGLLTATAALVQERRLPAAVHEHAQHLWALFSTGLTACSASPGVAEQPLAVNPTLEMREYTHGALLGAVDASVGLGASTSAATSEKPAQTPCAVLYFVHPAHQRARWRRADATLYALLRIVDEGIARTEAARMAGCSDARLQALLTWGCEEGFLVAA